MSCQQASRFLTNSNNSFNNSGSNTLNKINKNHSQNSIIKGTRTSRPATATAAGVGLGVVVVQQEDPYVFTESVPTTPPILFNTQKTRTRLNDLTTTTTTTATLTTNLSIGKLPQQQQQLQLQQQKLPLTEANGKITTNSIKTQASFLNTTSSLSPFPSLVTSSLLSAAPTTKCNHVTQSLTAAATTTTTTTVTANNICNSKKLTNVCIVRPQLQQQQPAHYHNHHPNYVNSSLVYEEDLKSISPPPLYTPPTPSLWQTPLLLESTTTTNTTGSSLVNNVLAPKIAASSNAPIMGCVTPTVQTVGCTTTTINPSLTTTAMAKVAPIVVHTPLAPPPPPPPSSSASPTPISNANGPNATAQCLPPSKFHNHTLAQHLHKVECLKKPKKSPDAEYNTTLITSPLKNTTTPHSTPPKKAAALKMVDLSAVKHSENEDLNEIPVNVIFRMALQPQQSEKSLNNIQFVKPQTEIETSPPIATTTTITPLIPTTPQLQQQPQRLKTQHVNKKLTIPASKSTRTTNQIIKQQLQHINTSSIQQQQKQRTALNSQQHHQTPTINTNKDDDNENTAQTKITNDNCCPATASVVAVASTAVVKNSNKTKTLTHISHNNKVTRKTHTSNTTNLNNLELSSNTWQMGCSSTTKGAVAIVKMSQHNIDSDTTHLATTTGLPYCLQQHWLNAFDFHKSSELRLMDTKSINRSLAREERIAVYKQQLRRQAMQLLSARSLQKLPLQVARRRLMCVDRLLRKYQQSEQYKNELPANVKRCCVNGCDAYTLEMVSYCQQHIVYNSAQHVFLPCTAKFADNTQCRVPVFDITHDLPLCMEHARKRDAYNRLLYEQRPRKISTNPLHMMNNDSTTTKSTTTISKATVLTNANLGGGASETGPVMKTQNYQQEQQKQHILQQLPVNSNNNNNNRSSGTKRATLVNPQARKRKITTVGLTGNPVGRPQKRVKKTIEKSMATAAAAAAGKITTQQQQQQQMPRVTSTSLKRKSSTTSLESIASNSQHSTTSSTSQQPQYQRQQTTPQQSLHLYGVNSTSSPLPPPALAPLSVNGMVGHGLPQHLFSFGLDNHHHHHQQQQQQNHTQPYQQQHQLHHLNNINDKHSFSASSFTATAGAAAAVPLTSTAATATTPTELKDFISQFSFVTQKHQTACETTGSDVNLLNTNSNSNFTSSGMGSTTSLPTGDDFLTQDMLSICENSSASSADTGLGGLSDPELMLGGPEDDIPLGDTHLLEEQDLENVLNSLPEDAFKELFTAVRQDESDEIERAIELADKHLKTLQQTIGSELGDFLDFNDDMLMDNGDLCNATTANSILDTTALFIGTGGGMGTVGAAATVVAANATQGGGVAGVVLGSDIRGLVQT